MHESVMVNEIVHQFQEKTNGIILDCTLGNAGHAKMILEALKGTCRIIGLDQDSEAVERSKVTLQNFSDSVTCVQSNFALLDTVLDSLGIAKIDGCLFDFGISSFQLDAAERGFSFRFDAPLDMRMDQTKEKTAADVVNTYAENVLADVLYQYGEEYRSRAIARAIVRQRAKKRIETTKELADLVRSVYPKRHHYKIDPSTKTFQALRIEVNDELAVIQAALDKVVQYLNDDGVLCALSFHSLEDRIVKHTFRKWAKEGLVTIVTKKPLLPTDEERRKNPRSRSAKLRIAKRSLQEWVV